MTVAFVDESGSNSRLDPHAYLLGAFIVPASRVDDVREAMLRLRLPGQRKVHWREESLRRQLAITREIGELDLSAIVVAHVDANRKPEQRRHRSLATLLPELQQCGVERAEFESRGPKDDARDRRLVDNLRRSHRLDRSLQPVRIDHTPGTAEPCLWAADALCGAAVAHRTGDHRFLKLLGASVRLLNAR